MGTLSITHSAAEGTLISGDPRPHHQIVKDGGFRWSRNIGNDGAWYLPQSRDRRPNLQKIERVAEQLRGAGFTVEIETDEDMRSPEERESDRVERNAARVAGLQTKATHLHAESDRKMAKVDGMIGAMAGTPVLVGHHSERRHRRDIERLNNPAFNGMADWREAKETDRRAVAAERNQAHRESLPATLRRIERMAAELRGVERKLAGEACKVSGKTFKEGAGPEIGTEWKCPLCEGTGIVAEIDGKRSTPIHYGWHDAPASGDYREQLLDSQADLTSDLAYWRGRVETAEAQGVKVWGPSDFTKGDFVKYGSRWKEVLRVNPKSLTVPSGYSWNDKITYDKVSGRRAKEDAPYLV